MDIEFHRPPFYPKQFAAIYDPARYSIIEASAQPLDTLVQTPSGARAFGTLKVGDEIFAGSGEVTTVAGVFPKGMQPVYRMVFSDGTETRASGDHLWAVDHYRDGKRVLTTDTLRSRTKKSLQLYRFPTCQSVAYPARRVTIDPWLLGVLIGDGSLCGNALCFASADAEIVERVKRTIPKGYEVKRSGQYLWRIVARIKGAGYERPSIRFKADGYEVSVARKYIGRVRTWNEAIALHRQAMIWRYGDALPEVNLRQELRRLGLLGLKHNEKFVPTEYLHNDVETRLEILRGIMDTDGSAGRANGATFEQTSARLAKDVQELVWSLGGFARIVETPPRRSGYKTSYRMNIRANNVEEFFWLPRKRERAPRSTKVVRKLSRIEFVGIEEVQCIAVDHPSKLYLTDQYIVTHNTKAGKTSACIAWLTEQAFKGREGWNYWWIAPVSEQARIAFDRTRRALGPDQCRAYQSPYRIALPTGPVIWFKSGDKPDSLYGEDVHAAVIDEASRLKQDAWYALRSTLTKTRGPARIIGNVHGRKNWFYRMARQAEQGFPDYAYHRLVAHDAVAAGVLAKEEIDAARRELPEHVFRELYLAEASEDGGNPFGFDAIRRCTVPIMYQGTPAVFGVDLAKSVDWTVVIGMTREGYVCRFERWQHVPWEDTVNRILAIIGNTPALVDSTGVGDPIVEALVRRTHGHPDAEHNQVEGYQFSGRSKQQLMEGLALAIQSGGITFPPGPIQMELEQFTYEMRGKEGRFTGVAYSAPAGFHDDCVMALALAEMHRHKAQAPMVIPAGLVASIRAQRPSMRHMR